MSSAGVRGRVAIVGVGLTAQGRTPDKTSWDLYADAGLATINDSGLRIDQIDGLITTNSYVDPHERHHLMVADRLGLRPRTFNDTSSMGGSATAIVREAMAIVLAGMAKYVLILGADNRLTALGRTAAVQAMMTFHDREFIEPYGNLPASNMAMLTRRHMHEYGWTSEQFAEVAVAMRAHAVRTPGAFMKQPITVADVLNSRMISDPFHLLECSIVTDGGVGIIVTSAERARDLPNVPVYILGEGALFTSYYTPGFPDLVDYPREMLQFCSNTAFAGAGLTRDDVDILAMPDMFSGILPIVLEGCGFCKKGDGAPFAASGAITYGGRYPTNTHGGNLSYSHPGNAQMLNMVELVKQLRGTEGARQVPSASVGFIHSFGGTMAQHGSMILANSIP